MNMPRTYVGYVYERVRTAPTSGSALRRIHGVDRQLRIIAAAADERSLHRLRMYTDAATTAGARFFERPLFLEALDMARSKGAILVVEDVATMLRHLDHQSAVQGVIAIANLDVPVLEIATQTILNVADQKRLISRVRLAGTTRRLKGERIKAGIKEPRPSELPSAASSKASDNRRRHAKRNAKRLAPIVRDIEAQLPGGKLLNANALATLLNERGINAPRGGAWTHGSAARLLKAFRSGKHG